MKGYRVSVPVSKNSELVVKVSVQAGGRYCHSEFQKTVGYHPCERRERVGRKAPFQVSEHKL